MDNIINKEILVEKRTLEELLLDLRIKKHWTYFHIIEKLNGIGLCIDEKTAKKWQLGLVYPNTDELYKLSQLYMFPIENFIMAKSNSYKKGMGSIHLIAIKWICYITGISIKTSIVIVYIILLLGLIYAFIFFNDCVNIFMSSRRKVSL